MRQSGRAKIIYRTNGYGKEGVVPTIMVAEPSDIVQLLWNRR